MPADRAHRVGADPLTDPLTDPLVDPLTGLGSRARLQAVLGELLGTGRPAVAVLLLDVDGFRRINEGYGPAVADAVLVTFAEAMLACIRSSDTAARLSADHFAIVLPDVDDPAIAVGVAKRILTQLRGPIVAGDQVLQARSSIGIALSDRDVTDPAELLRRADSALQHAKRRGLHGFEVYGVDSHQGDRRRAQLAADLRSAVARDELLLNYQPIVALHDGRMVGVEALVRWQHPAHGLVPPGEFIPLAEESGLIEDIGAWVLDRACAQVSEWRRSMSGAEHLHLSVNLSPQQVGSPHLLDQLDQTLARTGLPAGALVLELTEGVILQDTERTISTLAALRERGVRIAIDDFGTGYSSLRYLTRLPVDILKVDRCFIAEMGSETGGSVVAEAVIRLSQALRLETVAEGIELASQAAGMRRLGCVLGQGYYFARPLAADAFEELLGRLAADRAAGVPVGPLAP